MLSEVRAHFPELSGMFSEVRALLSELSCQRSELSCQSSVVKLSCQRSELLCQSSVSKLNPTVNRGLLAKSDGRAPLFVGAMHTADRRGARSVMVVRSTMVGGFSCLEKISSKAAWRQVYYYYYYYYYSPLSYFTPNVN
jgi:hypothetical protein